LGFLRCFFAPTNRKKSASAQGLECYVTQLGITFLKPCFESKPFHRIDWNAPEVRFINNDQAKF
jgi:hypothetical protein